MYAGYNSPTRTSSVMSMLTPDMMNCEPWIVCAPEKILLLPPGFWSLDEVLSLVDAADIRTGIVVLCCVITFV